MFQQTLNGSAREWFERLSSNNIKEWSDMREVFAARHLVRRACFKELHEITKIVKERWTVETCFIIGILKVMKISSFIDSVKSPELAKHFSSKVHLTVHEMMVRMEDFVRSKEAYARTKLPKGKTGEHHRKPSLPAIRRDDRPGGNTDWYCDYHQEKGHYTNDCIQLRKLLEMALESGKLNHLVKHVRQRGRGPQGRDAPQPAKIINMIMVSPVQDKNRKARETTKAWMNIHITFPSISLEDVSNEPQIVEAEVEGYLCHTPK
nr:reverse transcriptase domain-containing protein [Tanacetum cinerariifolium]